MVFVVCMDYSDGFKYTTCDRDRVNISLDLSDGRHFDCKCDKDVDVLIDEGIVGITCSFNCFYICKFTEMQMKLYQYAINNNVSFKGIFGYVVKNGVAVSTESWASPWSNVIDGLEIGFCELSGAGDAVGKVLSVFSYMRGMG